MTILKRIPPCIPPRLLYALASMGNGDSIVLADANFPSESIGKANNSAEVIRLDSMNVPEFLEAICTLMTLDTYSVHLASVMQVTPQDQGKVSTPVWDDFGRILKTHEGREIDLEEIDRFQFYERARLASCVVATGESALYGNLILVKGCWAHEERRAKKKMEQS